MKREEFRCLFTLGLFQANIMEERGRAYLICSIPSLLEKELTHIRTVLRSTNGYPNWIINQVFKQIKAKQKDPVPNSNVSNENEAVQTSNQTIIENS